MRVGPVKRVARPALFRGEVNRAVTNASEWKVFGKKIAKRLTSLDIKATQLERQRIVDELVDAHSKGRQSRSALEKLRVSRGKGLVGRVRIVNAYGRALRSASPKKNLARIARVVRK